LNEQDHFVRTPRLVPTSKKWKRGSMTIAVQVLSITTATNGVELLNCTVTDVVCSLKTWRGWYLLSDIYSATNPWIIYISKYFITTPEILPSLIKF
jgi:hypothetical protein